MPDSSGPTSQIETFDVVVLGAGPAGENAAQYAVQGSERTCAIVEAELVGGECSYYACIPSKALLRPVDVAAAAAHVDGLSDPPALDRSALLARRDRWVNGYDDASQARWAADAGLTLVRGRGRLDGDRTVVVETADGERTLRARLAVVLATGSEAVVAPEVQAVLPWTSRDATGLREVPESIVVIGGGVVACEAARWLAGLGAHVTMVVRSGLLGNFEPFAGELVAASLREAGVDVRLGAHLGALTRSDAADAGLGRVHGGPVSVHVDGENLAAAEVLVATGRRPATAMPDPLPSWLHVVGDVSGQAPLTHWGKYRGRLVGAEIAAAAQGAPAPTAPQDVPVPQVVFTDPQVASVGLTSVQAERAGVPVDIVDVPLSSVAGAGLLRDDLAGQARLVLTPASQAETPGHRRILGATFVGPEVAELLHSATVAIVGQLSLDVLWHAVPAYPTVSEVWLRLLEAAG